MGIEKWVSKERERRKVWLKFWFGGADSGFYVSQSFVD
jgi:hypothetical protein